MPDAPDPEIAANYASLAEFEKRANDIAIGAFERAKLAAQTVASASAAVALLYSTALGFVFSAAGTQLPGRGLLTPIFLGAAAVLAVVYLAFFGARSRDDDFVELTGSAEENSHARQQRLVTLVHEVVVRRSWALRASVVALGLGLAAMPLPFAATVLGVQLDKRDGDVFVAVLGFGALLTVVIVAGTALLAVLTKKAREGIPAR